MPTRYFRVLVPPPVAVPRGALWLGRLLDWLQQARLQKPAATPGGRLGSTSARVVEGQA